MAGCSSPSSAPSSGASGPDAAASEVAAAWNAGDRAAFESAFAPLADARAQAGLVWDNLTLLARVRLSEAAGHLRVAWSVGGEAAAATHTLAPRRMQGQVVAWDPVGPRPLWLEAALVVDVSGPAALLSTAGMDPGARARWADAARAAVRAVAEAGLGPAASGWDGTLVVEVPADLAGFVRVSGLRDGFAEAGAVTRLDAPDAAPRVVVNPVSTRDLSGEGALVLLTHEAVHAAIRSPWSSAPLWVVEGLAESVAASASGAHAARNLALARAYVEQAGVPEMPPSFAELTGGRPDPDTAYALAALAVAALGDRYGRERVLAWVADWSAADRPSQEELVNAYAEALGALVG